MTQDTTIRLIRSAPSERGSWSPLVDPPGAIPSGDADIVTTDGVTLTVGPGDVLVTPKGSAGIWVIRETITKFWVIYDG